MGEFKKPSRQLNKFLKKKNSGLNRRSLSKLTFEITSGVVAFNFLMATSSFAHSNTHTSDPAEDVTIIEQLDIPGTQCFKIVPSHTNTAHTNTGHDSAG